MKAAMAMAAFSVFVFLNIYPKNRGIMNKLLNKIGYLKNRSVHGLYIYSNLLQ